MRKTIITTLQELLNKSLDLNKDKLQITSDVTMQKYGLFQLKDLKVQPLYGEPQSFGYSFANINEKMSNKELIEFAKKLLINDFLSKKSIKESASYPILQRFSMIKQYEDIQLSLAQSEKPETQLQYYSKKVFDLFRTPQQPDTKERFLEFIKSYEDLINECIEEQNTWYGMVSTNGFIIQK